MQIFHAAARVIPALLLAVSFACPQLPSQPGPHPTSQIAPDFTRADLTGKPIHLARYRGKVVLLNFWATWCVPCLAEIPRFSVWQQGYGSQGLQVLGVSMDDDATLVLHIYGKYHLAYPVVMGDEHLGELYGGVLGLPVSYIISPQGVIVARYQGEPDLHQMESKIRALLPSPRR